MRFFALSSIFFNKLFFVIFLVTSLFSCKKDDSTELYNKISIEVEKSRFNPSEEIGFQITLPELSYDSIRLHVFHITDEIESRLWTETTNEIEFKWQSPNIDFKSYRFDFDFYSAGNVEYHSKSIDVSSDWTQFPRYGFLSKFGSISDSEIAAVISNLKEYQINGLQFYDWHHKHHQPLPMLNGNPQSEWFDIARREIKLSTVEKYIAEAHSKGMAAMSYNLINGLWDGFELDGANYQWLLYKDRFATQPDKHELDPSWAQSDIFLADPSNTAWQNYIIDETALIFQYLPFDGWHIDQLGYRGNVYTFSGQQRILWQSYPIMIESITNSFSNKVVVMNAVNRFGQKEILEKDVKFAYNEVWDPDDTYADLASIILENRQHAPQKKSVLAAYMNYDLADNPGEFNEPAVLMTNAVIFSFGGAHIELGEHMLGKEYFPNNNLQMSNSLQNKLKTYYDFTVGYQNVLRDQTTIYLSTDISSTEVQISDWNPSTNAISSFKTETGDYTVYHLLNFTGLNHLNWRDAKGTQEAPIKYENLTIKVETDQIFSEIHMATPDYYEGKAIPIVSIKNDDGYLIEIPYLEYWTMLILK